VGEASFFAVLFLLGSVALAALVVSIFMHCWPATQYFPELCYRETSCTVVDAQLVEGGDSEESPVFRAEIVIRYEVAERSMEGPVRDPPGGASADRESQQAVLDRFAVGARHRCWYDPNDPATVVVTRGSGWGFYLTLTVLGSFLVIGAGGLVFTALQAGTSAERRAALAKRAAGIDLISDAMPSPREYPTVPRDANLINSPGITLAYRLPISASSHWLLLTSIVFSCVLNVLVIVFIVVAINKHVAGQADWLLTTVTVLLTALGFWSIYYSARQFRKTTGIGPTSLEISDHPLFPGRRYDIFLTQLGKLSMRSLEVLLVCEEEATFRQGTDVRTERRRVFQERVFCREHFDIEPGMPFEHECRLDIPAVCMHSFQSPHNGISWSLQVTGRVAGWTQFERSFPVVVYPGDESRGAA